MTGITIRRFSRTLWRFLFAVLLLLAAAELADLWSRWQGRSGGNVLSVVWELMSGIARESPTPVSWWHAIGEGLLNSAKPLGLAVVLILGLGPPLGILAARFRRVPLLEVLVSPIFLAALLPAFWVACLVTWWRVEKWDQAVFAGDRSGFEGWWQAFLIAVIIAPPAVAWQIRSIAGTLRDASKVGFVRGALSRGETGSRLFYRHVFSGAALPVARCFDRVLPAVLGIQIFVEWAFRYPGLGTLMIDSAREGLVHGLLAGGIMMALVVTLARLLGESIHGAIDRRGSIPDVSAPAG